MTAMIRILGIDPGLRRTGWGVIGVEGSRLVHIAHGVIAPAPSLPLADRLGVLFADITEMIGLHRVEAAAVEETFVNANPRSALLLGQARGAVLAALSQAHLPVAEFAPRQIKLAVVGTGSADKTQIAFMVRRLLPTVGDFAKTGGADAADALACAMCGAHNKPAALAVRIKA